MKMRKNESNRANVKNCSNTKNSNVKNTNVRNSSTQNSSKRKNSKTTTSKVTNKKNNVGFATNNYEQDTNSQSNVKNVK